MENPFKNDKSCRHGGYRLPARESRRRRPMPKRLGGLPPSSVRARVASAMALDALSAR